MHCARVATALVLMSALAASANAQTDSRFSVGGNVGVKAATDESAHGHWTVGLLWRFGRGDTGWGFHWGLNWFEADIDRAVAGSTVRLGELHVRPVMVGYGYTYNVGKTEITGSMLGGLALTSLNLAPGATDAYHDRLGARSVTADASLTPVVRPQITVWYDINRKLGLQVNTGYTFARPRVTVNSSAGKDAAHVRADMFTLKVGLAYAVF